MPNNNLNFAAVRRLVITLLFVTVPARVAFADNSTDAQSRLKAHVEYLCSDAVEGRGLGSKGLDLAASYLAGEFQQCGLKTDWYEGTPFQKFDGAMTVQLGSRNWLDLLGPSNNAEKQDRIKLVFGHDYLPLATGGSGKLSAPLVFAGFGITNPEEHYDDYEGLDVAGKAAIIFSGLAPGKLHTWKDKAWLARKRGACAVFFVHSNGEVDRLTKTYLEMCEKHAADLAEQYKRFGVIAKPTPAEVILHLNRVDSLIALTSEFQGYLYDLHDIRLAFAQYANAVDPGYPVMSIKRSIVDQILKSAGKPDLSTLERKIAGDPKPQSMELSGWSIDGEVEVQRTPIKAKNVIAVLEGAGGLADETIVLGTHYDAVGFRDIGVPPGGLYRECPVIAQRTRYDPRMASPKVFHPGANDNASGAAVVLEVAREMADFRSSPRRRVVFIAFAAEEMGMIGSKAYVRQPLFPLDKTVAMINLDMVGRLQNDRVNVFGGAPPGLLSELLDRVGARYHLQFKKQPVKPLSEDQSPFHRRNVPTLYFATGADDKLHSPEDRPDRLSITGMQRISAMLTEFISELATNPNRPEFHGAEATGERVPPGIAEGTE